MPKEPVFKVVPVVKTLRIVRMALLVLYGLVFIGCVSFLISVLPSFLHRSGEAAFWAEIRVFLAKVLTAPIYVFIACSIFKLIGLISRGEFFSPAGPRHIRNVGYAVFGLAFITVIATGIHELSWPGGTPLLLQAACFTTA